MKKTSSKAASNNVRELEPFDKRSIDLAKIKSDLSVKDFKELFGPVGSIFTFPFLPIETLSCTKTIGRGRTNLTIIVPTIVQTDATTPRASFDRRAFTDDVRRIRRFTPSSLRRMMRRAPELVSFAGDTLEHSGVGPRVRSWINTKEEHTA